jgi:hypothetical protein
VQRGHEVTAFSFRDIGRPWELDGVHVETARRGTSYVREFVSGVDVVVSHVGDGGRGRTLSRQIGLPNVQMVHGANVAKIHDPTLVVFNSQWMRARFGAGYPSIVCHPPVAAADFATTRGDHVTIVNCSRLKGIRTAWVAAERLPGHRFLGVRGGYGDQVVPRVVNFETVPTTRNMRDDVYARTRVLLMPSEYESWGMVGVEAMCSGIPVVAHPAPGLVESLGPAGIFVDRDDHDGWVEAIRRLDDPAEYAAASARALARVAELDPIVSVDRFEASLEALARQSVPA